MSRADLCDDELSQGLVIFLLKLTPRFIKLRTECSDLLLLHLTIDFSWIFPMLSGCKRGENQVRERERQRADGDEMCRVERS
jgi:hypothetical protein